MIDVGYSSEDGFTFHTERGYLFHYVSESHYSIGVGETPAENGAIYWDVKIDENGKAALKGKDGVYPSYSEQHDTFQGNKSKPTGDSGFFIAVT